MTKSLFDTNLDDVKEIREAPPGKYVGTISYTRREPKDDGKEKISIGFKIKAAVDDLDLDGVNLNRYVYKTIILSEASFPYVKKELKEAGLDLSGTTLKDVISSLEGQDVEFTVGEDDYQKKQGREYRATVLRFKLAA